MFSESDKTNIKNGNPVANLDDKTTIKKPEEIELEGIVESTGKYTICVKVYVPHCSFDVHDESTGFDGCLGYSDEWHWECYEGGGGFSDFGDPYVAPNEGSPDMGSGGGGSGGGPGAVSPPPNNCSHCNEVITMPSIDFAPDDPCDKLKNVFTSSDPANPAVLSPNLRDLIVTQMRPNISVNPNGERAFVVSRRFRGQFDVIDQGTSTDTQIDITLPRMVFLAIHTHPLNAYPMFSWSDLLNLYHINKLNNQWAPWNVGMASFLLVCKDHLGNDQTYAVVFNEETIDMIDMIFSSPKFAGLTHYQIGEELDMKIKAKFKKEADEGSYDYEKAFLKMLIGYNISLYKADTGLTSWSRLQLNPSTNNVVETPCN